MSNRDRSQKEQVADSEEKINDFFYGNENEHQSPVHYMNNLTPEIDTDPNKTEEKENEDMI